MSDVLIVLSEKVLNFIKTYAYQDYMDELQARCNPDYPESEIDLLLYVQDTIMYDLENVISYIELFDNEDAECLIDELKKWLR